jgi:hypothetical protein
METPVAMNDVRRGDVLTVACACLGGYLGYLGFIFLARQGFYAIVLPGGLLGLAAGIPRSTSIAVPVLCGVLALVAGLLTEYWFAPFAADSSLTYFLAHAGSLRPVTLALVGLGGLIGFWLPFRRRIH